MTPEGGETAPREAPSAYHAMGREDADAMEREAMVLRALAKRIEDCGLTRTEAAERLRVDEAWLGGVLRGAFRRVAESDLAACLDKIG